jgi:hypothetical protein
VFFATLEDTLIYNYLYNRLKTLAVELGIRLDPSILKIVERTWNVKEQKDIFIHAVLGYIDENPQIVRPELVENALENDSMTSRIAGFIASLIAESGGITYEDAVAVAEKCGLSKTYELLVSYPNASSIVINILNGLATPRKKK